jgi:hypothetical protein
MEGAVYTSMDFFPNTNIVSDCEKRLQYTVCSGETSDQDQANVEAAKLEITQSNPLVAMQSSQIALLAEVRLIVS